MIQHRRSTRLRGFDYARPGAYFVTVCVHGRRPLLADLVEGRVVLSRLGSAVRHEWLRTEGLRREVVLDGFVIMADHVHALLWLLPAPPEHGRRDRAAPQLPRPPRPRSLAAVVRAFKAASCRRVNRLRGTPRARFWQRGFYDRVVRDRRELARLRRYVRDNPARWNEGVARHAQPGTMRDSRPR